MLGAINKLTDERVTKTVMTVVILECMEVIVRQNHGDQTGLALRCRECYIHSV